MAHWANWAKQLEFHQQKQNTTATHGWASATRLIEAHAKLPRYVPKWSTKTFIEKYQSMVQVEADRFRHLYKQSKALFFPLSDPLDVSIESHRQFDFSREEVYSDWLQWILEQLQEPALIAEVLGSKGWPADGNLWIDREQAVAYGFESQSGRLDLLIRDRNRCLAVVEVKTRDYVAVDLEKHKGYMQSLGPDPEYIFVAVDHRSFDLHQFRFISWADICIVLRRQATKRLAPEQILSTALILAFVGAVEQNLLKFDASDTAAARAFIPAMAEHLTRSMETEGNYGRS